MEKLITSINNITTTFRIEKLLKRRTITKDISVIDYCHFCDEYDFMYNKCYNCHFYYCNEHKDLLIFDNNVGEYICIDCHIFISKKY